MRATTRFCASSAASVSVRVFSTRRRHTRCLSDWSSDVCSSDLKLSKDTMLDIAYVGSSAANLSYQQDVNQLPAGTLQANPGANANALRPYLGYADIYQYMTGANFIYNSLQVQFKKQMAGGGVFNVAYTWSKARTDANGYNYQPMD